MCIHVRATSVGLSVSPTSGPIVPRLAILVLMTAFKVIATTILYTLCAVHACHAAAVNIATDEALVAVNDAFVAADVTSELCPWIHFVFTFETGLSRCYSYPVFHHRSPLQGCQIAVSVESLDGTSCNVVDNFWPEHGNFFHLPLHLW